MPSRIARVTFPGAGLILLLSSLTVAQTVPAPQTGKAGPARVLQYRTESGESYQAVLLAPVRAETRTAPHDHVVLFDTSASQIGDHRRQALSVLDGFVAALPQADRIRLFAIDVKPKELTTGFGTATSENVAAARQQLGRRAPLGATDLSAALNVALEVARESTTASVVYIGDGVSGSRLIQSVEMQAIVNDYRKARVPVSSFAIGPRKDLRVMGVLANWTGGAVLLDEVRDNDTPAGARLSRASRAQVFFPEQIDAGQAHIFPAVALPVRSDRETIYLSHGQVPETVQLSNGRKQLAWRTSAPEVDDSHSYLAPIVQRAEHEPISTFCSHASSSASTSA